MPAGCSAHIRRPHALVRGRAFVRATTPRVLPSYILVMQSNTVRWPGTVMSPRRLSHGSCRAPFLARQTACLRQACQHTGAPALSGTCLCAASWLHACARAPRGRVRHELVRRLQRRVLEGLPQRAAPGPGCELRARSPSSHVVLPPCFGHAPRACCGCSVCCGGLPWNGARLAARAVPAWSGGPAWALWHGGCMP